MKKKEQLRTYVNSNPNIMEVFKLKRIGEKTYILKSRKNTFLTILLGFVKEEINNNELIHKRDLIFGDKSVHSKKITEYELVAQQGIFDFDKRRTTYSMEDLRKMSEEKLHELLQKILGIEYVDQINPDCSDYSEIIEANRKLKLLDEIKEIIPKYTSRLSKVHSLKFDKVHDLLYPKKTKTKLEGDVIG